MSDDSKARLAFEPLVGRDWQIIPTTADSPPRWMAYGPAWDGRLEAICLLAICSTVGEARGVCERAGKAKQARLSGYV